MKNVAMTIIVIIIDTTIAAVAVAIDNDRFRSSDDEVWWAVVEQFLVDCASTKQSNQTACESNKNIIKRCVRPKWMLTNWFVTAWNVCELSRSLLVCCCIASISIEVPSISSFVYIYIYIWGEKKDKRVVKRKTIIFLLLLTNHQRESRNQSKWSSCLRECQCCCCRCTSTSQLVVVDCSCCLCSRCFLHLILSPSNNNNFFSVFFSVSLTNSFECNSFVM